MLERINCVKLKGYSNQGSAGIWEEGGATTNKGSATIICTPTGKKKKPVTVRQSGPLSNSKHALIPVKINDIIIQAFHRRKSYTIKVSKISGFDIKALPYQAMLELITEYSLGEWSDDHLYKKFDRAICAARAKAEHYHCKKPYYIANAQMEFKLKNKDVKAA